METTPRSGAARREAHWATHARQYLPHARVRLSVPVTFSYRRSDPLCVRAVFHCPLGSDITWNLGRDLLATATRTLVGGCDILGWPDPVDGRLWLRLGPHPEHALLSIDRAQLTAWLQTTYTLVPPGAEEDHLDWTPIQQLLTRG
ncbi:SsgA family sporulation/cell division regulator [Streptomyces sp. NPDC054865]